MVGDRLGYVEEELANQRFCLNRAQTLGQPGGIIDIEKYQDFILYHRPVIGADGQVKQGFDTNKMNSSHHDNPDHGKRYYDRKNVWQLIVRHPQLVKSPQQKMSQVN